MARFSLHPQEMAPQLFTIVPMKLGQLEGIGGLNCLLEKRSQVRNRKVVYICLTNSGISNCIERVIHCCFDVCKLHTHLYALRNAIPRLQTKELGGDVRSMARLCLDHWKWTCRSQWVLVDDLFN